jgi:hypothetical protein
VIVQHDVGLPDHLERSEGEQAGIARTGANQIDSTRFDRPLPPT